MSRDLIRVLELGAFTDISIGQLRVAQRATHVERNGRLLKYFDQPSRGIAKNRPLRSRRRGRYVVPGPSFVRSSRQRRNSFLSVAASLASRLAALTGVDR